MKIAEFLEALAYADDVEDDINYADEPIDTVTGIKRTYLFAPGPRDGRMLRLKRFLNAARSAYEISEPDIDGICSVTVDAPIYKHEDLIRNDLVDGLVFEGFTP